MLAGTPPASGTTGAAPPTGPLSLLIHTNLSAQTSIAPALSGLGATATVSDSLASTDTVSQPSSQSGPTLDTYHLVQVGFSAGGLAAFSFTGIGRANAFNFVPSAALIGSGYPVSINAFASAGASTSLSAGVQLFAASLQAAATGQALSIAPPYFFGSACPVQGLAQAIGGTVTHVQLLVDGKVVQDQTPSGQTSLVVSATFDSLVYAEGYLLPVTMQVTDSTGHSYDSTVKAPVHLPQVQFYDLWTPDYTAAPVNGKVPQTAASTGGVIGGNTTLHLRSVYGALTLTQVRLHLHSDPDTTKDTLLPVPALSSPAITSFGPPAVYSLWDVRCGDPDPSLPSTLPVSQYGNVAWNVGGRNGVYDVTATFTALGANNVVHTLTSSATFDREDLLITATTPANPTPLLWDPAIMQLVPISITIQTACKIGVTVVMKIYASDQTLVRTVTIPDPTHPVPLIVGGLNGSSVSATPLLFSWDGTKDDGTQAYSGVYMYQFSVSAANGDTDTDKSQSLSITTQSSSVQKVSNDGINAVYNVSYTLGSNDIPAKLASGGVLNVYDPNLILVGTKGLSDAGVFDADPAHDPNLLKPGPHTVTITIPAPKYAGDYVFLISVKDDDALQDKGGRQRYALQHNERGDYPGAIAWAFGGGSGIEKDMGNGAQYCYDGLHALGYNQMKYYEPYYTNPVLDNVRGPLESGFFTQGGYFITGDNHLQVGAIIGHGSLDSRTIYISQIGTVIKHKKYLTTLGAYDNSNQFYNTGKTHYAINSAYLAQDHLLVDSINSTNQPISSLRLAYMKMVIVSACDMDYGQGNGIPDVLLANGVRCVVVLGQHDLPVNGRGCIF